MREGDAGNVSKPSGNESDEIEAAVDVAIDEVDVSWGEAAANEETYGAASGFINFLIDDAIKSVVGAHVVKSAGAESIFSLRGSKCRTARLHEGADSAGRKARDRSENSISEESPSSEKSELIVGVKRSQTPVVFSSCAPVLP